MANSNLSNAKKSKNDEFYTQYQDIEKEINAYVEYDPNVFRGKTILLPCDDPEWSNFTKFFAQKFHEFGIKKLISTSYAVESKSYKSDYIPTLFETENPQYDKNKTRKNGKIFTLTKDRDKNGKIDVNDLEWKYLEGDGDFKSEEIKKLRDEADIIITNPPFSLFREFLPWIVEAGKKFVIIGNMNAITYKEVFPLMKENKMWLGPSISSGDRKFNVPNDYPLDAAKSGHDNDGRAYIYVKGVRWFTNLDHGRRHEYLPLMTIEDNKKFNNKIQKEKNSYQKYDNYDAIEIPFTGAIPSDYKGIMGVPITFLDKYNPDQFEIIGMAQRECHNQLPDIKKYNDYVQMKSDGSIEGSNGRKIDESPIVSGRVEGKTYYRDSKGHEVTALYMRIFIKHKKNI